MELEDEVIVSGKLSNFRIQIIPSGIMQYFCCPKDYSFRSSNDLFDKIVIISVWLVAKLFIIDRCDSRILFLFWKDL